MEHTGSSARVLNLHKIHRELFKDSRVPIEDPFFENKVLNNAIILKHKLRSSERSLFKSPPNNATKILLPIDPADLKVGARTIFVDQIDFDSAMVAGLGDDMMAGGRDRQLLKILNELPTLDPFLLREHLKSNGFEFSNRYFVISDSDVSRMFEFVTAEVTALVNLTTGSAHSAHGHVARLVEKLLSNAPDGGFEPLRETLKLTEKEYVSGIFAWRGFLYYKWVLSDLLMAMGRVQGEILKIKGSGHSNIEIMNYISSAKKRINMGISNNILQIQYSISSYTDAYSSLTKGQNPAPFKAFLLMAPGMFADLGDKVGSLQHINSFWNYRFPDGKSRSIGNDDLMDMFIDFEECLALDDV